MFFLAVLTWATLTKEPPKIVHFYKTLEECAMAAQKENHPDPFGGPKVQFVCLALAGEV